MRIGRVIGLSPDEQSHLFYALLLKDAGCSSNSVRVFRLFGGDDQKAKRAVWLRDWRKLRQQVAYVLDVAEPEGKLLERVRRLTVLATKGPASDEQRLNDIATAFAWVIDAKSPFTYHHSERVADFAVSIGRIVGLDEPTRVRLRRAGLLHDIGKLSVPNRILDKPAALTPREWEVIKLHPYYTHQILERVPVFGELAFDASAHHERLDGRGYYRNLPAGQLSPRRAFSASPTGWTRCRRTAPTAVSCRRRR